MGQSQPAGGLDGLCLFLCPLPQPPPHPSILPEDRWARPRGGGVATEGGRSCLPALGLSPPGTSSGARLLELCRISKSPKLKVNIFKGIKNADNMQLLHSEKQLRVLLLRQRPSSPSWAPTKACLDLLFPLHKGKVTQGPGLQGTQRREASDTEKQDLSSLPLPCPTLGH